LRKYQVTEPLKTTYYRCFNGSFGLPDFNEISPNAKDKVSNSKVNEAIANRQNKWVALFDFLALWVEDVSEEIFHGSHCEGVLDCGHFGCPWVIPTLLFCHI
jgi:hypothetical protein